MIYALKYPSSVGLVNVYMYCYFYIFCNLQRHSPVCIIFCFYFIFCRMYLYGHKWWNKKFCGDFFMYNKKYRII